MQITPSRFLYSAVLIVDGIIEQTNCFICWSILNSDLLLNVVYIWVYITVYRLRLSWEAGPYAYCLKTSKGGHAKNFYF